MLKVSRNSDSKLSTTVNTALITKMPTITPRRLKRVRKRLIKMACHANDKLSRNSLNQSMERSYCAGRGIRIGRRRFAAF